MDCGCENWESACLKRYREFGPLVFDTAKTKALVNDEDLRLTEHEFNALFLLAQRMHTGMTFEDLHKAVWELPDRSDRRAEARRGMDSLCRKVRAYGMGAVGIVQTKGGGYRLIKHSGHAAEKEIESV